LSALPSWPDLIEGRNCPLCAPREDVNEYSYKVADLSVSTLYLERDQVYEGYCVLIFKKRHVTGLEQMTGEEYTAFMADLRRASLAVHAAVKPDLMNYASLGNVIPHTHVHIIPRTKSDPRWGAPVWLTRLADMQKKHLEEAGYQKLLSAIRAHLE
jgi:diadenosine tetraphosphate (Ap4A) HIT family hydrolase